MVSVGNSDGLDFPDLNEVVLPPIASLHLFLAAQSFWHVHLLPIVGARTGRWLDLGNFFVRYFTLEERIHLTFDGLHFM